MESASLILTGKGKKRQEWNPASDDKANILKDVIGPGGNLRAPTWRIGNELLWALILNFMKRSLAKW